MIDCRRETCCMATDYELDTSARQAYAARRTGPPESRYRPYSRTPRLSIAALVISIGSFGISWFAYQDSTHMAASSHTATANARNASLVSEIRVDRNLPAFDQASDSTKPTRILLSWTLTNPGSTAARQLNFRWVESLTDKNNSPIRASDEHNLPMDEIGPHRELSVPLAVELTPDEFQQYRRAGAKVGITGEVRYRDVSGRDHRLNWSAQLNGDAVLTVQHD